MRRDPVEGFGAYRKAEELLDLVVQGMEKLQPKPMCWKLVSQQVAACDSICANIDEGYGRETRPEFIRFLVIARGSAREARGRYKRMKHWLSRSTVSHRVGLCDEIIGILNSSITTMKRRLPKG